MAARLSSCLSDCVSYERCRTVKGNTAGDEDVVNEGSVTVPSVFVT